MNATATKQLNNLQVGDIFEFQSQRFVFISASNGRDIYHIKANSDGNPNNVYNIKIRKFRGMGILQEVKIHGNDSQKAKVGAEKVQANEKARYEKTKADYEANSKQMEFDRDRREFRINLANGEKIYVGDRVRVQFDNGVQVGYVGKIAGTESCKFGYKLNPSRQNRMLNISMILNKVN